MLDGRDALRWPGIHPLGALPHLQRNPLNVLMKARFELGEVVNLRLPYARVQVAASPKIVEHILLNSTSKITKQTRGYDLMRQVLGNGLLTSEGSFWLRQRRLAQPAFHREHLTGWGNEMVRLTRELADSWQPKIESGEAFDVSVEMMKVTMRIVAKTMLSAEVGNETSTVTHAITHGLQAIQHRLTHPFSAPLWVPTKPNRVLVSARRALDQVVYKIIAQRRAGEGSKVDLLALLMNATDAGTGEQMNDVQLRDEVMTTFLAGHETTAVLMSWTMFLLSKHPGIERKVRAEVQQVLQGREAVTADVPKLPYLGRVLKEVLRLYPPAWLIARRITEDMVLDGWNFPAKTVVMISAYVLHRLPESFHNPEGFDPDRWLDEEKLPRGAYIPFSMGPRKCIGDSFAQLEAALILATLITRVTLSLVPGQAIDPEPMITIRPRGGLKMVASKPEVPHEGTA